MEHPRTDLLTPLERACAYLDAHRMAALSRLAADVERLTRERELRWKDEVCSQCGAWPKQPCPVTCPVRVCRVLPCLCERERTRDVVVFHAGAMHGHAPTLAEAIMHAARSLGWDPGQ